MRYIRTKDEIIAYDENADEIHKPIILYYPNQIIKQADTIEELCDEFVGVDSLGHYIIHNDEYIKGASIVPLEEISYYGAIWTEWGLKYVAKMNEKGELELL